MNVVKACSDFGPNNRHLRDRISIFRQKKDKASFRQRLEEVPLVRIIRNRIGCARIPLGAGVSRLTCAERSQTNERHQQLHSNIINSQTIDLCVNKSCLHSISGKTISGRLNNPWIYCIDHILCAACYLSRRIESGRPIFGIVFKITGDQYSHSGTNIFAKIMVST